VTRTFVYVLGTRPNVVKMAPVIHAMRARTPGERHVIIHTGQHSDDAMSGVFLRQLDVPSPDHHLAIGFGTADEQLARIEQRLTPILRELRPRTVVVAGDVTSTLGAANTADGLGLPVAHVEAGLRSFDRSMPEERNRIAVDALASLLFTHSPEARANLRLEGVQDGAVHECGNTMIDSLDRMLADAGPSVVKALGVDVPYVLVTLHRPALTDGPLLRPALDALEDLAATIPVIFPVHPRTRERMARVGYRPGRVQLRDPVDYVQSLALQRHAAAVLTDSGGVQEETTALGVPCFTLRDNTERPVTLTAGTNVLLGLRPERIAEIPELLGSERTANRPKGWDGYAGLRVAEVLDAFDGGLLPRS
jgi:UDP-N-acetylglucosamine 2-epimerase (non-hydrolysing)